MYHGVGHVGEDPFDLFVSPERFRQQMAVLRRMGLRGVSLGELGDALADGTASGLVGLTFDDAYEDVTAEAIPVLEGSGFTATVFVVSGLVGGHNDWDPPPRRRLMNRADVRAVAARGMEIGSHTVTHARLAGLDAERLHHEVADSRAALADLTGVAPRSFCFPYGSVDAAAVEAVQAAGYSWACAVWRADGLPRNVAIPRVGVTEGDWPLRFAAKLFLRGR
jgi:peptidoglycan/xylan/chitin deacetylase (PgdA/CDA1 family)